MVASKMDAISGATKIVGSTVAAGAGVSIKWLGLTMDEWAIIGIVGGIGVALLGGIASALIRYADYRNKKYHRELEAEDRRLKRVADLNLQLSKIKK